MIEKGWSAAALVVLVGCKVQSTGSFMGPSPSSSHPTAAASGDSRNLTVPDVRFMTRAEAETAIARAGFERPPSLDTSMCGSVVDKRVVARGRVCYQHPPAGRQQGSRIPITIRVQDEDPYGGELGGGRRWFLLPDLVGVHVDEAKARIKQLGFTRDVKVTYSDDPSCKPNIVCKTVPEGLSRTDTTSDKLFYVGRPPEPPKPTTPATPTPPTTPATPTTPTTPTTPATPSMGDAF